MSKFSLIPVLQVDETKCVNCHACITVCPVKYCNDGSGTTVTVNHDMCIACGKCIDACTHDARNYIDDFTLFINDIIGNNKIVAIAAPAVAASFPDMYLHLNTWLKQLGVEAVFDVGFGAELTTKSYIDHIQTNKPQTVIAQPCAAIVTYIELYKPELIKYLAPVDSPMLHTVRMIKEFYPQYKNHKIAVISPCSAKKREFEETGLGDYNIAHKSIVDFLKTNEIDLSKLEKTDFDNPSAERAVMFSSPGGLLKTAERWVPDIAESTRRIEGTHIVYDYLKTLPKMIDEGKSPLLIDCLSCDFGCNAGPLTDTKNKPQDEIEYYVTKRSKELKNKYLEENENNPLLSKQKIEETLDKYWKEGLYERKYVNRWKNVDIKYPTEQELKNIYASMHKYRDEDIKNCSACGYGTCEGMATAILNKLNKPENCYFYIETENTISIEKARKSEAKLTQILDTSVDGFVEVDENEIIVRANPAFKKILKKSDIVGKPFYNFIDKKNLEIFRKEISSRKDGVFQSYELELKQSDGKVTPCLISASPLYSKGIKKGSFAMITDISELKDKENKLKEFTENLEKIVQERTAELNDTVEELNAINEVIEAKNDELEQLSIVASETDNAIVIMDNMGNFQWVNNAFTEKYGLDLENLKKILGKDIITATKSIDLTNIVHEVLSTKKSQKYETEDQNKNNETIYTQTTLNPILDKNNKIKNLVAVNTDITELKIKENEILEQATEMEELLEELHTTNSVIEEVNKELEQLSIVASETDNAIMIMDSEGNFEWVNPAYEMRYGRNLHKLISTKGKNITDANNKEFAKTFKTLLSEKKSVKFKKEEINRKGETIYSQVTLTPVLNENGEIHKIVSIKTDITELVQVENNLLQKSAEMAELIEELNTTNDLIEDINKELEQLSIVASETDNAIVIMDGEGNFEWVNDAFFTKYGMYINDLIKTRGKGILEANNNSALIKESLDIVIKERKSATYQQPEINAEGQQIYTQTTLTPIFDNEKNIKNIVAINTDISELKEAEEKINQKNEEVLQQQEELMAQRDAIADSEEQIKYILSSLPDAAMVIDKNGEVTFWNTAIENMTGVKAEDIIGKGNHEYAIPFYGERKPILIDLVTERSDELKKYTGIVSKNGILQAETFVPDLKGKEQYLIGTASVLKDSEGNYAGAIEIIHNITHRKNIELELKKQQKHTTDSIVYASRIQKAMLPPERLIKNNLSDYFICYKPLDIVSGDFYWITKRNFKIIIVAADSTGHGVPGAFMSMLGISFLNEIVNKDKIIQPNIILNKLRDNIKKSLRQKGKSGESQDGMDVAICSFEPGTGILEYSGAYNPLFIVRNKELIIYKADKMPVGISRKDTNPFTLNTIKIQKNDSFYIFSDGFVDQVGEKTGRKFLIKHFKTLLVEISEKPMKEQKNIIEKTFIDWKQGERQVDDILIMGFKI